MDTLCAFASDGARLRIHPANTADRDAQCTFLACFGFGTTGSFSDQSANVPARYCTGYVSDIGLLPPYAPMDFAVWMEVYLGGKWHTFDPRNNAPRIGRILIAYGRDAADVPLTHIFGPGELREFRVWTDEATGPSN